MSECAPLLNASSASHVSHQNSKTNENDAATRSERDPYSLPTPLSGQFGWPGSTALTSRLPPRPIRSEAAKFVTPSPALRHYEGAPRGLRPKERNLIGAECYENKSPCSRSDAAVRSCRLRRCHCANGHQSDRR